MNDLNKTKLIECLDNNKIVYINLACGLGNRLFKIASAYGISKSQNKLYAINNDYATHHNTPNLNYNETIFRNVPFKNIDETIHHYIFYEQEKNACKFLDIPNENFNLLLYGYFQNEKYFLNYKKDIYELFKMESKTKNYLTKKYQNLDTTYFLHVRRGDYTLDINDMHRIDFTKYYENCFKLFPEDAHFLIFSDEIDFCKNLEFLKNKNVSYVENENEVNSLYLMTLCNLGGIACNSTFSWWGGYLNENPDKKVTFPDQWFKNDWNIDIYWENSIIVSTI